MAVANTKSTQVTNADATPKKQTSVLYANGVEKVIKQTVETLAADDDTSVYRLARLFSSWSVHSIVLFHDAITSGTDYDLGLYDTAENGGAVVDINAYADAVDISSADTDGVEVAFEARDVANINQKVYEDGGVAADPADYYDLCLTGVTVGSAAGTISAVIRYTEGQ